MAFTAQIQHHDGIYTAWIGSILEYGCGLTADLAMDDLADSIRELNVLLRSEDLGPGLIKIRDALERESVWTATGGPFPLFL